ncbi:MAG: transcription antitermination factor NusB [Acidobacteriota bacterium]
MTFQKSRRHAREAALKMLYMWEVGQNTPQQAIGAYFKEHDPKATEEVRAFASELVFGTSNERTALDAALEPHLTGWRIERLAILDRMILRMALWELQHHTDTPPAVVINEAMELARLFTSEDAVKFINGVLDAAHKGK